MKKLFTLKFNYSNSTLIFTAFLMMITISCRKEMKQLENNSKNVTNIQIKNGRLIFESLEDFNSLMLEAHSNKTNSNYLQEKLKLAFGNDFHSLESYKEIQNSESQITLLSSSNIESKEPLAEKLVPDVIFASVLNQDGVIQIEKTVYKVTKFGTFMASEEKILKIDSLINAWESKNNTTNKQSTQYKTNSFNGIADDYLPFEYAQEVQDDFYSVANNISL